MKIIYKIILEIIEWWVISDLNPTIKLVPEQMLFSAQELKLNDRIGSCPMI